MSITGQRDSGQACDPPGATLWASIQLIEKGLAALPHCWDRESVARFVVLQRGRLWPYSKTARGTGPRRGFRIGRGEWI